MGTSIEECRGFAHEIGVDRVLVKSNLLDPPFLEPVFSLHSLSCRMDLWGFKVAGALRTAKETRWRGL